MDIEPPKELDIIVIEPDTRFWMAISGKIRSKYPGAIIKFAHTHDEAQNTIAHMNATGVGTEHLDLIVYSTNAAELKPAAQHNLIELRRLCPGVRIILRADDWPKKLPNNASYSVVPRHNLDALFEAVSAPA